MAVAFAVGSSCFLVGPFPGYAQLVGERATALTFFVGSIFFTIGGALQSWLAFARRHERTGGSAASWSAIVQSAGTLFFNRSTFQALDTAFSNPQYNHLVWRPDAFGSICFLVSGVIAYKASPRRRWLPRPGSPGWWQPAVNLLGCIFFGISAVAGYVVPSSGSLLDLAAANWNTSLGAACFLGCALGSLHPGAAHTASPQLGDAQDAPVA
jgi:YrhK-like protein